MWRVDARTAVHRGQPRSLRLELPEGEDYETMAGLVLERLKHIPREGESVRFGGVLVKVTRASRARGGGGADPHRPAPQPGARPGHHPRLKPDRA